ncbi:MAG TPA: hypothetical protein VFD84_02475 [Candidatus Binatia bacterium]|jgi:hypothetical protein|nr:hypothetical protein [Candidatus Binatia bacterium]
MRIKMVTGALLVGGLAVAIAVATAGTPFGGDDSGTIPSDAPKGPVTKCEGKIAKGVGKLVGKVIKCHGQRASGKLADDAAEDACEQAAIDKFTAQKTTGCPACIALPTLAAAVVGLVDANNNRVYCAPGTPFGGDDTGNIPADAPKGPVTKCEGTVGTKVAKLVSSVIKCHSSRATGKLADDAAEDECEAAALAKFTAVKTTGCDACTDLAAIGQFVISTLDASNGLVYCGSPGGAFLDGAAF